MQQLDDKYAIQLQDGPFSNYQSADAIEAVQERAQAQILAKGKQPNAESSNSPTETREAIARREETDGAVSYTYTQNTDLRGASAMREQEEGVQRLSSSPIRVPENSDPLLPGLAGEDQTVAAAELTQMKSLPVDSGAGYGQRILGSVDDEE